MGLISSPDIVKWSRIYLRREMQAPSSSVVVRHTTYSPPYPTRTTNRTSWRFNLHFHLHSFSVATPKHILVETSPRYGRAG